MCGADFARQGPEMITLVTEMGLYHGSSDCQCNAGVPVHGIGGVIEDTYDICLRLCS